MALTSRHWNHHLARPAQPETARGRWPLGIDSVHVTRPYYLSRMLVKCSLGWIRQRFYALTKCSLSASTMLWQALQQCFRNRWNLGANYLLNTSLPCVLRGACELGWQHGMLTAWQAASLRGSCRGLCKREAASSEAIGISLIGCRLAKKAAEGLPGQHIICSNLRSSSCTQGRFEDKSHRNENTACTQSLSTPT